MTVLELMVVLAIIAGAFVLVRSGFRLVTRADLVENATELQAIMKRTGQLAVETAQMHRILFDLDKQVYAVEVCEGAATIQRNEKVLSDKDAEKKALEKGTERLRGVPIEAIARDPEEATRHAMAIAGKHIADRTCMPANEKTISGIVAGAGGRTMGEKDMRTNMTWVRALRAEKGIKFKEIWVQHRDESVTKGQVAIYFFPTGSSEKAVVEITDDSEVFTVEVFGLTGRVVLKDGALENPNDVMMRNVMGDKEKEHDAEGADK